MTRILLVDDVMMARSMAERVLRHVGGYDVQSVSNGMEAINAAQFAPPDLIILDISMGEMDGIATLQELRERGIECPVIAFTARVERTPGEFAAQGFNAYASKTGDLRSLLDTVRNVLSDVAAT
ncbi:MAG TPA: response regulator [Roseiflexaceae bacterium]|nr:response regulator [Roseiflexaceae bacterium]